MGEAMVIEGPEANMVEAKMARGLMERRQRSGLGLCWRGGGMKVKNWEERSIARGACLVQEQSVR